jgi:Tfp pilus assembly protein PilX
MKRFLRHRLRDERGFALVAALGFSVVLGIAGTTAMVYTTSNEGSAQASKADRRALSLAEAGLANAHATLYNASNPADANSVPLRSDVLEGGTATWSGVYDAAAKMWTLTGVGSIANPLRASAVTRTVRGRVKIGTGQVGTSNNAIWNYIYAEAPTTCMSLGNSVNVAVPLYVKGDLCLTNSSQISGSTTVLQVGGKVSLGNSSHIGQSGSPIAEVHVAGGCTRDGGPLHTPCTSADSVYAGTIDGQVTPLSKPPVDLPYWYANSKPGPLQACTTVTGTPPLFDTDSTLNRSLPLPVNLTPAWPYDCQVRDSQGTLLGRLKWDPNSKALTVHGTIFFDGDIEFGGSAEAFYSGRATIYASGKITMRNAAKVCGSPGCNSEWQPLTNLLAFVAGSSTDAIGFSIENSGIFQGATYVVNDYSQGNSVVVWGPIIARQVYLENSVENHYVPIGTLLSGMPATYEEVATLTNEPGGWS